MLQIDPSVKSSLIHGDNNASVGLLIGTYPREKSSPIKLLCLAATTDEEAVTMETLRPSLISHHVKQLLRMLPGGLSLLGLYGIQKEAPKATPHLLHLKKTLKKCEIPENDLIFLHFNNETKKFDCNIFDKEMKPVKYQVEFEACILRKVECDFDAGGVVVEGGEKLEGVGQFVGAWAKTLQNSIILFNSQFPSSDVYQETDAISILIEKLPSLLLSNRKDFVNHLNLVGKMHLVAYCNQGESTAVVAEHLITDLKTSLSARLQMHVESLVDEESDSSTTVYHEIPRRVLLKMRLDKEDLLLSDYLFPGEGPADCIESFKEILGVVLEAEDIIEVEGEFDPDCLATSASMEQLPVPRNNSFAILSLFVLFIAIFMAYFLWK